MKSIHQPLQIDNSSKITKKYSEIKSPTSKKIAAIAEGVLSPRSFLSTKKQLANPAVSHHFFGDTSLENPERIYHYLNDVQDEIVLSSKLDKKFSYNDTAFFSDARPKTLQENYNRTLVSYEDFIKEKKTFYSPCEVLVREVRIFEAFQKYESNNHEQFSPYFFPEKINFALSTDVSKNFTSFSRNVLAKIKEVTYSGNWSFSGTKDYDQHLELTVTAGILAKFGRIFDLEYMKKNNSINIEVLGGESLDEFLVRVADKFNLDILFIKSNNKNLDYSNIIKAVNDLVLSTHSKETSSVATQTDIEELEIVNKSIDVSTEVDDYISVGYMQLLLQKALQAQMQALNPTLNSDTIDKKL